ncbi:MAG: hypothetical protein KatS3mg104_0988 [Phycisphaerae bacterium]|jgi:uncharacterized membrane protein|nr:MAG: hypothetical protein KatS3mg104_0988 [Phycisphaerae bacterium]
MPDTELLQKIPLFSRLDPIELARLSELLEHRSFHANQPVIWIGETGQELFIIQHGQVVVSYPDESGNEKILNTLGPGDFFGDVALLDGGPRTASVRTITESQMLVLKRDTFLDFLRKYPDAAIDVLVTLGKRHREMLDKLRGIANPNQVIEQKTSRWERIADTIAMVSASQPFVLFHVVWFSGWVGMNLLMGEKGFDPFPFGLLTLIVSLEAIFLSIFVLVSANRSSQKDRIRADVDHQVNLKAQYEIMQLHTKLDQLLSRLPEK